MSVVYITSLTGQSPFDITICDKTKTYCETVATGIVSVPPILELQVPTSVVTSINGPVLVVITDSLGCEEFRYVECSITPTPTKTQTVTPTVTPTPNKCRCYTLVNPTSGLLNFEITLCDDKLLFLVFLVKM